MEQDKLSACYFPTTVMFIDDNQNFLTTLSLKLDVNNVIPKLFFDPESALQYLETDYQPNPFTNRSLLQVKDEYITHRNIDINLQAISQEIYNPLRYSEISVIVVDYAMPSSNGLDFAREIKAKGEHFKVLMLTGEADETIAVEAFNEGVIDQFIRKGALNFHEITNSAIRGLQHRYFQDLSDLIMSSFSANNLSISCFDDPVFIQFFNRLCQENEITEYYLTDTYGGFLLLNFEGVPSWLAVRDEEGMEDSFQIANFSNHSFPKLLLEELKNREKMLVLFQENMCDDSEKVEKYIFPCHKLEGKTTYYYNLIKDVREYAIFPEKIFSCRTYLDETPL